ncbi:MAG: hypothetical protein ACREIP_07330 [Alphaproteobacteria bacterium]
MRPGRHGKNDKRRISRNARAILGLAAAEAAVAGLFALAFWGGWYSAAVILLVVGLAVLPLIWLLLPLFRKC